MCTGDSLQNQVPHIVLHVHFDCEQSIMTQHADPDEDHEGCPRRLYHCPGQITTVVSTPFCPARQYYICNSIGVSTMQTRVATFV